VDGEHSALDRVVELERGQDRAVGPAREPTREEERHCRALEDFFGEITRGCADERRVAGFRVAEHVFGRSQGSEDDEHFFVLDELGTHSVGSSRVDGRDRAVDRLQLTSEDAAGFVDLIDQYLVVLGLVAVAHVDPELENGIEIEEHDAELDRGRGNAAIARSELDLGGGLSGCRCRLVGVFSGVGRRSFGGRRRRWIGVRSGCVVRSAAGSD